MRNHPGCLCLYATVMLSRGIYPWQRFVAVLPVTGALCRYPVAVSRDRTHVTVPRVRASRVRNLVVPCVLTPQLPPCAIPHLTPYPLSILPLLACHPLPTRLSSLSRRSFHPFVVSTPAFSDSSHVSFHGVRTKTFSTHVTTKIAPDVRETGLFTHAEPH